MGLYVRSLCFALDEALEPYRQTLIRIEKELMADPNLTAAYVQMKLEEVNEIGVTFVFIRIFPTNLVSLDSCLGFVLLNVVTYCLLHVLWFHI